MIRVLHYIPGFLYGGIESVFLSWYRNIDRTKIEFDLLLRTQDSEAPALKDFLTLGGEYYRLKQLSLKRITEFKNSVRSFFDEHHDYDIIHLHESDPFVMQIAKKFGIKNVIIHSHTTSYGKGNLKGMLRYIEEQYSMKHYADYAFACSEFAARWKFKGMQFKGSPVTIINNSIDPEKFFLNPSIRNRIRYELALDSKFVLINVGRISAPKNQFFLLDIFKEYYEINPDSKLLVVGDGPDEVKLRNYATKLGMEKEVTFTGVRSDVPDLLQAADCFVLPSLWEGLPLTMIEAQASGLPCFISDVITTEADITDSVFRLSVNNEPLVWAHKIEEVRGNFIREFQPKAVINHGFDVKTVTNKLVEKYKAILERKR